MSCGSYGLTVRELEERISYPAYEKPGTRIKPISTKASRALLESYRQTVTATGARRSLMYTTVAQTTRPVSSAALVARYERAIADGRPDDAIVCLLEAIRSGENSHDAFHNVALLKHQAGAFQEAIDYYSKAVERDPMRTENYQNRAECHMALNDAKSAFTEWVKYFKLSQPTKSLLVKCGKCALDCDLLDESEYYLKAGLADEAVDVATDAYAYFNLGELYELRKDDATAQIYFAKVCEVDPSFPTPYLSQAESDLEAGNYTSALHLFEAVAKMLPTRAYVFIRLADVYEHLGEEFVPSVLECLSRAIDLNLESDSQQQELALARRGVLLLTKLHDLSGAESDLTRCLAVNPRNATALMHRALVYRTRCAEGDFAAAVHDYSQVLELTSVTYEEKYEPHLFLARAAFLDRDFHTAARYFAFAGAFGPLEEKEDQLRFAIAIAHGTDVHEPAQEESVYEPRQGYFVKEVEKGKKAPQDLVKNFPYASLSFILVDQQYQALRDLEPTAHSALELELVRAWKPVHEDMLVKREEFEAARGGKKGGAKKK